METRRTIKKWCFLGLMTFLAPMLVIVLGTVACDLIEATGLDGGRLRAVSFNAHDCLCVEGESTLLRARIVRDEYRRRGVAGCIVRFNLGEKLLGESKSDELGYVQTKWSPPKLGDYVVKVHFAGASLYGKAEDELLCSVRPKDRRTIIVDIDNTLAVTRDWYFLDDFDKAPLVPCSLDSLTTLADRYAIIYLTARMVRHRRKTLQWLAAKGFPRNPAIFLELDKYPRYSQEKYKKEAIARLKTKCGRIVAGVGDKESDGKAYLANGLRAIILDNRPEEGDFEYVSSWPEIEQRLLAGLDV